MDNLATMEHNQVYTRDQTSHCTGIRMYMTSLNPLKSMINLNLPQTTSNQKDKGERMVEEQPPTQVKPMMSITVWNIRRANSAEFTRHCISIIGLYKFVMLAFLKIRTVDHHQLTQDLVFDG